MGVVADGSPELMPAGSASQAAAGQDTNMLAPMFALSPTTADDPIISFELHTERVLYR